MTEEPTTTAAPPASVTDQPVNDAPTTRRCPWCSEPLPEEATERCPSCHANLVAEGETRLPGLTEVEAPGAVRVRRAEAPKRSKLLSWISGDIDEESGAPVGDPEAVALPPRDVRREMLRLQLEAEGITVAADGSIEVPAPATPETAPRDAGHGRRTRDRRLRRRDVLGDPQGELTGRTFRAAYPEACPPDSRRPAHLTFASRTFASATASSASAWPARPQPTTAGGSRSSGRSMTTACLRSATWRLRADRPPSRRSSVSALHWPENCRAGSSKRTAGWRSA